MALRERVRRILAPLLVAALLTAVLSPGCTLAGESERAAATPPGAAPSPTIAPEPATPTTPPSPTATPPSPQAAAPPAPTSAPRAATPALDCRPHSFPQRTQRSFALDPTDDRKLYVGVEQEGFFKSADGGETWQRASKGLQAWSRLGEPGLCFEEFYATVIDPRNPDRLCIALAGGPGTIGLRSSAVNNGVYCSRDGAESWTQMVSPSMNTAVYTLAADPTDFNVMYAGVNGGPCSNPPPICPPGTYFNTTGAIYKTLDGGRTWRELNALYVPDLRVVSVRVDPRDPRVVLAGTFAKLPAAQAGPGAFESAQAGVLRSVDGGETWTSSTRGMNADPRERALLALEISSRNPSLVYVTASSNQSYWSADGGVTFNRAQRLDPVAFDPHDPTGLHMLGAAGESIRESRDGGRTWTTRSRTPGFVSLQQGTPTKIEWSRTSPSTVFLAGPYAAVYRSTDGGTTWNQILSADRLPK